MAGFAVPCPGRRHKSTNFSFDGYYYVKNKTQKTGVINLVCQHRRRLCNARARYENGIITVTSGSHNHPRDYLGLQVARLREAVKDAAETTADSLAEKFDDVCER
jgi:hypothetical protein